MDVRSSRVGTAAYLGSRVGALSTSKSFSSSCYASVLDANGGGSRGRETPSQCASRAWQSVPNEDDSSRGQKGRGEGRGDSNLLGHPRRSTFSAVLREKWAKREGKRAANHVHCLAYGTVLVGVLTVFRLWEFGYGTLPWPWWR